MTRSLDRRSFLALASSVAALGGMTACGFSGSDDSAGTPNGQGSAPSKKDLVYAQSVPVSSLEPSGSQPQAYPAGYEAAFAIFSGLVRFTAELEFEPELATEWTTDADGRTWTFKLRPDVTFHDGTAFDAKAVVPYFTSMLDEKINLAALSLWSPIESITEIDPHTIAIKTAEPYGALLNTLAHGSALIPSPKSVGADDFALKPVGAGPYQLDSFKPGSELKVVAFADYHRGQPAYDSITFRHVGDSAGRMSALQSGQADVVDAVPVEQVETLQQAEGIEVLEAPGLQVFGIGLCLTTPQLQDKLVRQALNYAVDTDAMIEAVFRGHATAMNSPLAPDTTGYVECGAYDFSIDKAKQLLDEAGWVQGDSGARSKDGKDLSLKLRTPDGMYPNDVRVAQVIQEQLKAIGVTVTIDKIDESAFWDSIKVSKSNVDFDMVLFGYNPSHGNGAIQMDALYRTNPSEDKGIPQWNFQWFENSAVDDSITAGQREVDDLAAALKPAQTTVWDECPYIWLYVKNNISAYSTKVAAPTMLPVVFTLPSQQA